MRYLVINIMAIILICCQSINRDISKVQTLLKEKAKINLKRKEIKIKKIESNQIYNEWSKYYIINIPDSTHRKIYSIVKNDSTWKEIEKGYQLSIIIQDKNSLGFKGYGFFVSKKENRMTIQVNKE